MSEFVNQKMVAHLEIMSLLSEEFLNHITRAAADPETMQQFRLFFYTDLPAYRFSLLNEGFLITRLWDAMRGRPVAFDTVLELTSAVAQLASHQPAGWDNFLYGVLRAMSVHQNCLPILVEDREEQSSFCTEGQAKELLQASPWLGVLYLLRMTESYNAGQRQLLDESKKAD